MVGEPNCRKSALKLKGYNFFTVEGHVLCKKALRIGEPFIVTGLAAKRLWELKRPVRRLNGPGHRQL